MLIDFFRRMPVWQSEGAGAGAAGDPPPDAAAAAAAGAGAGDPPPAASTKWWEGSKFTDDQRKHLTASGLTVDDPIEAAARLTDMHRNAMQRIGKGLDTIIDKPGKDQPLPEWMKANREVFGLPENANGYTVERPADWPKDAAWDTDFETQAKAFAFENGIPPAALQGLVGLYAQKVAALNGAADTQLAQASEQMRGDLTREWGPQTNARILRAGQAAQALAEKAGMGADQLTEMAKSLSAKTGDANVIRLFDTVAQMMGDDTITGAGKSAGTFGTTPAEARQQLAQLTAAGGAWYEATNSGNSAKIAELQPQIERLSKIAAGS